MTLAARLWSHVKDAEHAVADNVKTVWNEAKPKIAAFYHHEKEAIKKGGTHLREFYQAKKHELMAHLHKEKKAIKAHHEAGDITTEQREEALTRVEATTADLHRRHEQNVSGQHKETETFTHIPDHELAAHQSIVPELFGGEEKLPLETVIRKSPLAQKIAREQGLTLGHMAKDTPQRALGNRATYNQTFNIRGGGPVNVREHKRRTKKGVVPVCKHIRNVKKTTKKVTRRCKR